MMALSKSSHVLLSFSGVGGSSESVLVCRTSSSGAGAKDPDEDCDGVPLEVDAVLGCLAHVLRRLLG